MKIRTSLVVVLALAATLPVIAQENASAPVTLESMLREMTDLARLAHAPQPGTRLLQFSSYDRKSQVVDGEKKDWYANADIGHYLRSEQTPHGTEFVMAEVQGPGAIVRMWSANAGKRIWRVYLDGNPEPVIEAEGNKLLDGLKGGLPDVFSDKRNFGYNLYLPIPFQNGCKVTVARQSGKEGSRPSLMYYHVDIRTFPAGTKVESFSWETAKNSLQAVQAAEAVLKAPEDYLFPKPETCNELNQSLPPGQSARLTVYGGPAALDYLGIAVLASDRKSLGPSMGKVLLQIRFDGADQAQVVSPVGEFFGAGFGLADYQSLPLSMGNSPERSLAGDANGPPHFVALGSSRWVMPFQNRFDLTLTNHGDTAVEVRVVAETVPWDWSADSLYFHAAYRQWDKVSTRPESDLTLLQANGVGRYVGTELNVRNHLEHYWWGEGDEKIYVDGEAFPSIFGTGTEDYFGYAWCVQYFKFMHAYHGVPKPSRVWLVVPQLSTLFVPKSWVPVSKLMPGFDVTSQYRWHIIDDIPFEKSIRFDMELLHHQKALVDMAAVTYWYAAPGATDDAPPLDLKSREIW